MFVDLDSSKGQRFDFRMSSIDQNTGDVVWNAPVEGLWVEVRSWKPFFEEQMANQEQIIEWKINPKTHKNERHVNPKPLTPDELKKQREDAIDYALTGWSESWKDKKTKKPIPCTRENKMALMSLDFFDRFFTDCIQTIDSRRIDEKEAEAKNSPTSQSGGQASAA